MGVVETTAALLLLTRRTAFAGTGILVVAMIGAMATHLYWGHSEQVTGEVMALIVATVVALGRRKPFFLWGEAARFLEEPGRT